MSLCMNAPEMIAYMLHDVYIAITVMLHSHIIIINTICELIHACNYMHGGYTHIVITMHTR